jgi:hypothetical protein
LILGVVTVEDTFSATRREAEGDATGDGADGEGDDVVEDGDGDIFDVT